MDNFKQLYMDNWLEILYGPFPKYFEKTKNNIIVQAYAAVDITWREEDIVYYNGLAYSIAAAPFGSNPQRIDLTGNQKDQMTALFKEKVEIANEQTIVKGYLSRILNLAICSRDIHALLPESICSHLTAWNKTGPSNVVLTITKPKRDEFQKRNKQFSDLIAERILTNLLLQHGR